MDIILFCYTSIILNEVSNDDFSHVDVMVLCESRIVIQQYFFDKVTDNKYDISGTQKPTGTKCAQRSIHYLHSDCTVQF